VGRLILRLAVKSRMEVKLDKMMEEFCQLKSDMKKKFVDSMNEFKREMSAA